MDDFPALIRAARGYAGISQTELAQRLGVEVQWVKRREAARQDTKPYERSAIGTACRVRFIDHGLVALAEEFRQPVSDGPLAPEGELGRDLQDDLPTERSQPQKQRRQGPGSAADSSG